MAKINNAQDLLAVFGMPADPYFNPVVHVDTQPGFSIFRHYPTNIRFKPALRVQGEPDDVVLIKIIYKHNRLNEVTGNVPVLVRFARHSVYFASNPFNFEYDYTDPTSPTRESVKARDECPQPLSGSLDDEFVFSTSRGRLETVEGEEVTGAQILERAFSCHCDSVHPIRGLRARSEVAWVDGVHNSL